MDRFDKFSAQWGYKTAQACREIGISRSLLYEIRGGKREVTSKMFTRLLLAERTHALPSPTGSLNLDGKAKNESGSLIEELALWESDPDVWHDVFDHAVLVANARLVKLLQATRELVSLAKRAAVQDPALSEQIADCVNTVEDALKHGDRVQGDFMDALSMLTSIIPDWLEAATKDNPRPPSRVTLRSLIRGNHNKQP